MIVDCHVHVAAQLTGFWEPLRFGKVRDRGQVRQAFPPSFDPPASLPDILLGYMDMVGVDRAHLVQHHMYGDQNSTVLDAIQRWPDRFVGFAYLGALDQPDATTRLKRLIDGGMTGLKVELASTRRLRPSFRFDGPAESRVWSTLNVLARPLVLDLNGGTAEDTAAVRRLVERYPRIKVAISHVGGPEDEEWQERALLARHPRVWTDLAALPMFMGPDEEYPYPRGQERVRWAVEHLGADKVMWGTDYPFLLNRGTYQQLLDVVRRHCDFLSLVEKAAILGENAARFVE